MKNDEVNRELTSMILNSTFRPVKFLGIKVLELFSILFIYFLAGFTTAFRLIVCSSSVGLLVGWFQWEG